MGSLSIPEAGARDVLSLHDAERDRVAADRERPVAKKGEVFDELTSASSKRSAATQDESL